MAAVTAVQGIEVPAAFGACFAAIKRRKFIALVGGAAAFVICDRSSTKRNAAHRGADGDMIRWARART
jgi:hypothetical protein